MRLLLDTHLLLWGAERPDLLSQRAMDLIEDYGNEVLFSSLSICEIAIKQLLGRRNFTADAQHIRSGLLNNGYQELELRGTHALGLLNLPLLHGDPFDRLLMAQATVEGMTLLTNDETLAKYPGPVLRV